MSTEKPVCPDCGAELSRDAPKGFCPKCLFARAQLGGLVLDPTDSDLLPAPDVQRSTPFGSTRFGDYELLEEVAHGGMGVVWRARQTSLDRTVAVKMILRGQLASREYVARFKAEAAAAAQLQHPNIVAIYEVGEHDGQNYFSMEYVEGRNLAELVREGPLPAKRAARYVRTIAEAIHYAHQRQILHRDLKPSNVLIDAFDQPRVTDFGLAKRLPSKSETQNPKSETDLTITGQVLGSPNFMPPEQAAGKHSALGPQSDVYALGAILYHLVTGRPPFVAETVTDTLRLVAETDPVSPRLLTPSVPGDLDTICLRCLEKAPGNRYPTAQAMADELGRFLRDEPILARPVGAPEKLWRWCRRKPLVAGLGAALVLVFTVGLAGIVWQWRQATLNADAEKRQRVLVEQKELTARRYLYDADMDMAAQSLELGDSARASGLLERHRPGSKSEIGNSSLETQQDLRGWEWRYMWHECLGDELCTAATHSNEVLEVAFSADGLLLASGGADGTVKLWDVARGRELRTIDNRGSISGLVFSPDGHLLATGGSENIIRFWDTATWQPHSSITNRSKVSRLAFSPDNRSLAASAWNGMTVWEVATGRELAHAESHLFTPSQYPVGIAFGADSRTVAYAKAMDTVGLMDTVTQTERLLPIEPNEWLICSFAFSRDGSRLIGAGSGNTIRVWDIASQTVLTNLAVNGVEVKCLALSSDGQGVVAGYDDGHLRFWELNTWRQLGALWGHSGIVRGVSFSPDGALVATGSSDGTVKLWSTGPMVHDHEAIDLPKVKNSTGRLSPDGRYLVNAVLERVDAPPLVYSIWDTAQLKLIRSRPAPVSNWRHVAVANDGTRLAFGDLNGTITLWDDQQSQILAVLRANLELDDVLLTPDGRMVVAAGLEKIIVWDLTTLQPVYTNALPNSTISISADGRYIAGGGENGKVKVLEVRTGREVSSFAAGRLDLWNLGFSPDGKTLFTIDTEYNLKLCELPGGRQKASFSSQLSQIGYAAISTDGKRLAGCLNGGPIKMWDLETYQEVGTFWGLKSDGSSIAFLPDGETLVAASSMDLRRWRAAPLTKTDAKPSNNHFDPEQPGPARLLPYRLGLLLQRGKWSEAEWLCSELLARSREQPGNDSTNLESQINVLADILWGHSRFAEAERMSRESLALARKLYTNDAPKLEQRVNRLANVLTRLDKYAEAEPLAREVIVFRRGRLSAESDELVEAKLWLAFLLTNWAWAERDPPVRANAIADNAVPLRPFASSSPAARAHEAEGFERASLAARAKSLASTNMRLANGKWGLGGALVSVVATDPSLDFEGRRDKFTEAETLLLQAAERLLTEEQAADWWKRATLERLVRLYEAWNAFAPTPDKAEKSAEWKRKLAAFDQVAVEKKPSEGGKTK